MGIGWRGREGGDWVDRRESGGEVISRAREWGYGYGWIFREKKRK